MGSVVLTRPSAAVPAEAGAPSAHATPSAGPQPVRPDLASRNNTSRSALRGPDSPEISRPAARFVTAATAKLTPEKFRSRGSGGRGRAQGGAINVSSRRANWPYSSAESALDAEGARDPDKDPRQEVAAAARSGRDQREARAPGVRPGILQVRFTVRISADGNARAQIDDVGALSHRPADPGGETGGWGVGHAVRRPGPRAARRRPRAGRRKWSPRPQCRGRFRRSSRRARSRRAPARRPSRRSEPRPPPVRPGGGPG